MPRCHLMLFKHCHQTEQLRHRSRNQEQGAKKGGQGALLAQQPALFQPAPQRLPPPLPPCLTLVLLQQTFLTLLSHVGDVVHGHTHRSRLQLQFAASSRMLLNCGMTQRPASIIREHLIVEECGVSAGAAHAAVCKVHLDTRRTRPRPQGATPLRLQRLKRGDIALKSTWV